jgi:hypothetical protein
MKMVYTNESNILVNNVKNLLGNEGISVSVKNEHVSTGAHPNFAYMELWINRDSDYPKAMELLASLNSNDAAKDWICTECNETNDASFEICWNCRKDTQQ